MRQNEEVGEEEKKKAIALQATSIILAQQQQHQQQREQNPREKNQQKKEAALLKISKTTPKLTVAVIQSELTTIKELLSDPSLDVNELDEETMSALHFACNYNEPLIVSLLLAHPRCDPNCRNKRGGAPIHSAVQNSSHSALEVLLSCPSVLINAVNEWSETPLILSAQSGDLTSAQILMKKGADLHASDKWGKTAIEVARDHGELSLVQFLSDWSSNNGKDPQSQKPEADSEVARQFSKLNFKANNQAASAASPSQVKKNLAKMMEAPLNEEDFMGWLTQENVDVTGADFYKWTALHKCAAWNRARCLVSLLNHPAFQAKPSIMIPGQNGDTPLHVAIEMGAAGCVEVLLKDTRTLPFIDLKNDLGFTPLMVAAQTGDLSLTNLLLNAGAKRSEASPKGLRAVDFATQGGYSALIEVLT